MYMTTTLCFIPFFKSKIGFPTNLIGKTNLQCGPRTRLVRDIILNINSFFFANSVAGSLGKVGERAFRKLLIRLQICLWPKMLGLTDVLCSLFQQTKKKLSISRQHESLTFLISSLFISDRKFSGGIF